MNRILMVAAGAVVVLAVKSALAANGQAVYQQHCEGCHSVLSPKLGDKTAWAPLAKNGDAALTAIVIKGKGGMPPRGGASSDADVKAAVDYMLSKAK